VIGTATQDVEAQLEKERSSGHGQETKWQRKPVEIMEFLATILDREGKAAGEKELVIVANDQEIIRGPEPNPYWHGRDWIIAAPLITVPFSQYGRTYVESFRQLADAFTELTNLINDAIFTNTMNAFIAWPAKFLDPKQLDEGMSPNKIFLADDEECGTDEMPLKTLELGDPRAVRDAVAVWQGTKQELREGGMQNELNLGQLPPKGDITATEIMESKEGTNTLTTQIAGNTGRRGPGRRARPGGCCDAHGATRGLPQAPVPVQGQGHHRHDRARPADQERTSSASSRSSARTRCFCGSSWTATPARRSSNAYFGTSGSTRPSWRRQRRSGSATRWPR
jgi:hypothetical protein